MRDWNARLSSTVRLGIRLNCWNTRPSRSRRNAARPASLKLGDHGVGQPDLAAIGGIEAGDQMQQRALAAAGFAGQRDALAGGDGQVHPAQHRDLFAGGAVALGQAGHVKHVTGHAGIAVGHARQWTDLTMKIP